MICFKHIFYFFNFGFVPLRTLCSVLPESVLSESLLRIPLIPVVNAYLFCNYCVQLNSGIILSSLDLFEIF